MRYKQRFHKSGLDCHSRALAFNAELQQIHDPQIRSVDISKGSGLKTRRGGIGRLSFCQQSSPVALLNSLLFVSLGLLQVADGFLTYIGLSLFDLGEVNPILNYCAAQVGLGCSITLIKFAILAMIALLFINRRQTRNCWGTLILIAAVSFYTWVVNYNAVLVITS